VSTKLSSKRVVLAVLVAALLGVVGLSALPRAEAQQEQVAVGVISNLAVVATNGFSNLPEFSGSGDGVLGVACTGATPRSGNMIPGQVVTELRTDLTYLRIIRNDGAAITGTVRINCVLEVEATALGTGSLERLQEAAG
jgi:hypothetical protein